MPGKPLFELQNVSYTYEALNSPPYTALRKLNLRIDQAEFVAILGASGSGKSTLMHLLGLMSDPTLGEMTLNGKNVALLNNDQKSEQRNQRIGFLFQQFFLLPQLTVLENIMLPTEYFRGQKNSDFWIQRAQILLERFGLDAHQHKRPAQLSGGQNQRAALCRALIMNPDILMCDEPTGALDSETAEDVLNTLVELNKNGTTIIVITHDPEVARRALRIIKIGDGEIKDDYRTETNLDTALNSIFDIRQISAETPEKGLKKIKNAIIRTCKYLFIPTFQSLLTHRLRTILTMTGLMLGVASVFIMLTLTGRVNLVFKEFFETQGSRKAFVSFDWRQAERTGAPQWRGLHATEDIPKLNAQLSNYGRIDAAIDTSGCKIISTQGNLQSSLTGINSLQEAQENGLRLAAGRLPMPHEFMIEQPARVALLGSDAAKKLFPALKTLDHMSYSAPLGDENVIIRGCEFEGILKVIGVLKPQDSLFDRDINSSIYIPSATLLAGGISPFNRRVVTVPYENINPTWFAKYVVNKLRIITSDKFPFRYFAAEQELEKFNMMMGILTGLTLVIGGLCTLIGGIGVMNIMLVNVHERLREIGIRKAVGARDNDIRGQFLLESTGLCLMSGLLGIGLGLATSSIALQIAKSFLPQALSLSFELDFTALLTALLVSMGAGLVFGTWPARRASKLQIVDALRQE